jgi:hypothetical protein
MDSTLWREADTMGFYVCVTLFATMAVGDDHAPPRLRDLLALIWLTTVGLALAHWLAATIAARLVPEGLGHHRTIEILGAHLLLPATIAAATTVVVLVVPDDIRLLAGRLTAGAGLALLVGVEARRGDRSPGRALRLALLSFACAAGIAVLKRLLF